MKRKILLRLFFSFMLFFSIPVMCADKVKLYRNFPVYPPEKIEVLLKTDSGKFRLYYACNPGPFPAELGDTYQMWQEKKEKYHKEVAKAKDYILTNAKSLGWNLIEEDRYDDGGSYYWKFIKKEGYHSLSIVVKLWCGISGGRDNSEIEYIFNE